MSTNLTPFGLSAAAVTARNAEYADTPFTDVIGADTYADPNLGCNRAGSNSPGIGINTGNVLLTAAEIAAGEVREDWTLEDQLEAARIPLATQHGRQ